MVDRPLTIFIGQPAKERAFRVLMEGLSRSGSPFLKLLRNLGVDFQCERHIIHPTS